MHDASFLQELFVQISVAIKASVDNIRAIEAARLREVGDRDGQYRLDLHADEAALRLLSHTPFDVLSEESGYNPTGSDITIIIDPVDGSTNASRQIPWYATSLCAVDADGPWVGLVENLATGDRYEAVRGHGATLNGKPIQVSPVEDPRNALVVFNGHPRERFEWKQFRAFGATALDICSIADGRVDATMDFTNDSLSIWDFAAAVLIVREAGGVVCDVHDRDLYELSFDTKRSPIAASSEPLHAKLKQIQLDMTARSV